MQVGREMPFKVQKKELKLRDNGAAVFRRYTATYLAINNFLVSSNSALNCQYKSFCLLKFVGDWRYGQIPQVKANRAKLL